MTIFLFANNANTTLAGAINSTATSCALAPGTGALFPNPSAGQQFAMTFVDAATGLQTEIVYCTARSGDTCTIVRGQEGTVAQSWVANDIAANLLTAGTMNALIQSVQLNPVRQVTGSGAFAINTADGSVGLNRSVSPAPSSATLPSGAFAGQVFSVEDLLGNFQAYPVTISAPAGMSIAGEGSIILNVNRQCAYFKYYGGNIWSVKL